MNVDDCSYDELFVVDSFDESTDGKWTERVSVGDFNGGAICWDDFPLSRRIPLSDIWINRIKN